VWIYDAGRGGWDEALRNRPVTGGDRIATDQGARAVIQVGSATLRLGGASEVEWVQLDDDGVRVRVLAGSVALRVFSADVVHEFQLLTPRGRVLPLFAGHYRVDLLADSTVVEALQGEAVFDADDSRLTVVAGRRVAFWSERGRTHYDVVTTPLDDFGRWLLAVQRDEQRAWASTRHVSPETTGWEDLDRYGRWDHHPQYGVVWIPSGVAVDWAPYRYGRWVWIAPWGWTWVDDAPWGFAPFHYGRWVWWDGRWAWWPGTYVRRPVYAPALVGWIGGSHFSIGISIGSTPWVGWVPLSPYDVYRPWYRVTRPPVHVPPPRPVPRDRAAASTSSYFYLSVPGSVTVVSRQVLDERRPVGPSEWRRVDPDEWRRAARPPAVVAAPPPPAFAAAPPSRPAVPPPPPRFPRGGGPDRDERGDRDGGPGGHGARFGRDEPRAAPPVPPWGNGARERNEIRERNEPGERSSGRVRDDVPRPPPAVPFERGRGPTVEPGPRFDGPPRGDVPRAPMPPMFERSRDSDREREREHAPRGDRPERGGRPDGGDAPPAWRMGPPDAGRPSPAVNAPPAAFSRERIQPVSPGGRRGPEADGAAPPRTPPFDDPRAFSR
jgi:hypothetical protein